MTEPKQSLRARLIRELIAAPRGKSATELRRKLAIVTAGILADEIAAKRKQHKQQEAA